MRKLTSINAVRILIAVTLSSSAPLLAVPFKIDFGLLPPRVAKATATGAKVKVQKLQGGGAPSEVQLSKERAVTLDFPSEGLYSVQVLSDKGEEIWKETVYVLLNIPSNEYLMRASWAVKPGTMRTVLRVQDPAGVMQYGVSIRDKIFLRLRQAPRLVRVFQEDYSGLSSPAGNMNMGPVTETAAREENATAGQDVTFDLGEGDDQLSYEPAYKGLLAGKEDKSLKEKIQALGGAQRLEPLNRPHRIYGWVRMMQEDFRVRRNPDTYNGEKTQGFGTGFGGDFVVKDTLSLQLEVDTHGTRTDYEDGGTNTPAEEQRRIHARVGPLFDVLNVNHKYPRFAFEIGPVVGYTQIPLEKDNEGKTDFGGSLRWQYFGAMTHVEAQFRWMKSHSRDLSLIWMGTGYQIMTISPLFGVYSYHTEFDAAEAKGEFDEAGVRFGIHREF